ncbi:hypothetical protein [Sphingobacterium chuzhouense]|uniref:Uncharacterized protein n=1 Tax=Sphingobacterium chuzhouense TaxID=1742264 RepID=A0ABR7XX69_9SPHI|nr:hypothetical protein [Sphingobacterium chuzhouense]MBD1423627.1 hypothetical protein [Sphingobacterium chuzhouense]
MGIRYEKDTILNWINEMGKFLRLLVDKYEAFDEPTEPAVIEEGYHKFFGKQRDWLIGLSQDELLTYVEQELETEQIRPLALLFLRDALLSPADETQQQLLYKSKFLLEHVSQKLASFSFEDYGNLTLINERLQK